MLTTKASIQDILDNDLEQQRYEQTKEGVQMTNAEINAKFLEAMSFNSTKIILKNIADHYGVTPEQAYNSLIGEGSESLIDYMTGTDRDYYGLIMIQFKHNIGVN